MTATEFTLIFWNTRRFADHGAAAEPQTATSRGKAFSSGMSYSVGGLA
jgi:hypothetical protein